MLYRITKQYLLMLIITAITIVFSNITVLADVSKPASTPYISYAGQVVDSITYRGTTTNAVYTTYRSGLDTDWTYGCFVLPRNFYSNVYGITVSNLVSTSATPNASSGYFFETRSPRKGDIVRFNNWIHWAIVKDVNGSTVTLIQQNAWWNSYTCAQVGVTVSAADTSVSFFTYSGYLPDTSASNADQVYPEEGTYIIYSALDNNKCLDVCGTSNDDGANIHLYEYCEVGYNKFKITTYGDAHRLTNVKSNKCVDVWNASPDNGANIWQYTGNDTNAQKWIFEDAGNGYVYIRSALGKYMDVYSGCSDNGTNIWTYTFNGSDSQKFRLARVSDAAQIFPEEGIYVIYSALDNNKCLDVCGTSNADGANIHLYEYCEAGYNKFRITAFGDAHRLTNFKSNKCVDVANASPDNGANVQQYMGWNDTAQKWIFEDAGNGYVYIRSALGKYMDVYSGYSDNGTNIWTYTFNGSNAQKFKLVLLEPHTETTVTKDDALTVSTNLINITSGKIIVAGYNDNKVIDFAIKDYSVDKEIFVLNGNIDKVKVMVWDGLDSLKPLTETEVIPQSKWILN